LSSASAAMPFLQHSPPYRERPPRPEQLAPKRRDGSPPPIPGFRAARPNGRHGDRRFTVLRSSTIHATH
jgi:hypothetical protein